MKRKVLLCQILSLCILAGCESTQPVSVSEEPKPETIEEVSEMKKTYEDIVQINTKNAISTNNKVFEGWGTSLCWWANRIGYSDKLSEDAAKLFFGEDGLSFNIMRYNIGGGDDPSHTHITRTDSNIPGWTYLDANGNPQYNYEADYNQLNVLEKAYRASGDDAYVEVFSNSPPYYMTVSGCSSGAELSTDNNLKEECYEAFAKYLADVTNYIVTEKGIRVKSVDPMNEPDTNYWAANSWKQEGCHFDGGELQSRILVDTRKAFDEAGLTDVILTGSDETSTFTTVKSYNSYTDEAKQALGRISTHSYDTTGAKSLSALQKKEGFNLWMSEVDGGEVGGEKAGEMGSGLYIAKKIISDFNEITPSAWVMWQVIDNHISQDGYNKNQDSGMVDLNAGFWGAAVCDHDKEEIILTQKYYAIGQFSRYIRPGDTVILCDDNTIASYSESSKRLSIVMVNSKKADKERFVDLEEFDIKNASVKAFRTLGTMENGEHWNEVESAHIEENGLLTNLPGNSITTYVIENVELR